MTQFFDQEASETKEYYRSSEEEGDDKIDNDSESEKSKFDKKYQKWKKIQPVQEKENAIFPLCMRLHQKIKTLQL